MAISSLFLFACAEKKTKTEKNTTAAPKVENSTNEINQIDSITHQLEKAKDDIDKAPKKLMNY